MGYGVVKWTQLWDSRKKWVQMLCCQRGLGWVTQLLWAPKTRIMIPVSQKVPKDEVGQHSHCVFVRLYTGTIWVNSGFWERCSGKLGKSPHLPESAQGNCNMPGTGGSSGWSVVAILFSNGPPTSWFKYFPFALTVDLLVPSYSVLNAD